LPVGVAKSQGSTEIQSEDVKENELSPQERLKILLRNLKNERKTDINELMVNYLKKSIVKQVDIKIKEEMKTQCTDEKRVELYEKLLEDKYLGQRNLIMRLAKQKFSKIHVNLAGINPNGHWG
jgi:hypothetical protein